MEFISEEIKVMILEFIQNSTIAIVLIFAGRWAANMLTKVIGKMLKKARVEISLAHFLENVIYYTLMAVILIAALAELGVQTASLIAIMGAAGLAVGLSLQSTLSNIAAGVMIIFIRAFKIGDLVEAGGEKGKVLKIDLFNTTLSTPDNTLIVVPNSKIFNGSIKNFSYHSTRRIEILIGISYETDIQKARSVILDSLKDHSLLLDEPAPKIIVKTLSDSSVDLSARVWVKTPNFWPVFYELQEKLKVDLEKNDIQIPYPQMDVHVVPETS